MGCACGSWSRGRGFDSLVVCFFFFCLNPIFSHSKKQIFRIFFFFPLGENIFFGLGEKNIFRPKEKLKKNIFEKKIFGEKKNLPKEKTNFASRKTKKKFRKKTLDFFLPAVFRRGLNAKLPCPTPQNPQLLFPTLPQPPTPLPEPPQTP